MPENKSNDQENPAQAHHGAFDNVAPRSIEGVEASDLPDKGRGSVETDYGKEAARDLPQQTGEGPMGQAGMRAHPDLVQADVRGGRKKN